MFNNTQAGILSGFIPKGYLTRIRIVGNTSTF